MNTYPAYHHWGCPGRYGAMIFSWDTERMEKPELVSLSKSPRFKTILCIFRVLKYICKKVLQLLKKMLISAYSHSFVPCSQNTFYVAHTARALGTRNGWDMASRPWRDRHNKLMFSWLCVVYNEPTWGRIWQRGGCDYFWGVLLKKSSEKEKHLPWVLQHHEGEYSRQLRGKGHSQRKEHIFSLPSWWSRETENIIAM